MIKVLVCGGRDFGATEQEYHFIARTLNTIFFDKGWIHAPDEYGNWLPDVVIISGEARGVDRAAASYASTNWTGYEGYPADWETHGKKAGILRNVRMLEEGKPDLVVAFPGGRGTAHMVKIAKEAGVPVIEVTYDSAELL